MRQLLPALLTLTSAGCSNADEQIECPALEAGQLAGTLRETPQQIKAAGDQLGRGSENEIAEVSASIRSRHADATKSAIVNYLVTAFCPTLNAKATLDKPAKRQALQSFSQRAEKIVQSMN